MLLQFPKSASKPRVYSYQRGLPSACSHYRIVTPLKTAAELGLAEINFDTNTKLIPEEEWLAHDLHLYYLLADRNLLQDIYRFDRELALGRRAPSIIFDSDDNIKYVSPFNPKFSTLGTHLPDGSAMGKGDHIDVELDDGEIVPVWQDGQQCPDGIFDIERNHQTLRKTQLIARASAGVTTTCEELANEYRSYGCRNVFVFPNSLRREDYPEIRVERPKKVTILWEGGYSHYLDFIGLGDAFANVCHRRPNVEFVVWGQDFPAIHRQIPAKNFRLMPWVPYEKYTLRLATVGHHINLCPLSPGRFNECKSAIKFYESSAIHRPAATLASKYGPFTEILEDETGLLFDSPEDFEDKLVGLIDDAALRNRLAKNAHEWVWENRDATKTVPPLMEWYKETRYANQNR